MSPGEDSATKGGVANAAQQPHRPAIVLTVLALTGTVVSLQATIVLPLLPEFPRLLGTDASSASWLITATLLTGAVATPIVSRLADMFGKKRMMLASLGVLVVGSAVGALGQDLPLLVAARALQGVGMALVPVGIAMMRDELPRDKVPLGVALMSATMAIGAGLGLPLCGLVVDHLGWHSVFWLTGVIGLMMAVAIARVLHESTIRTRGTFDFRGALVLSVALTCALLALSKGTHWGWASAPTLGLGATAILLILAWIPLELRVPSPLVDIRIATRRPVLLVNGVSFLLGFAMYSNMLVPLQLLQLPVESGFGFGLSVKQAGLVMAPSALAFGLLAPGSAWITRRWGPPVALSIGAGAMAVVYAVRVYTSGDVWQIIASSVVVAAATSIAYAAMPTLIMRSVPVTETASANGLNTLMRSVGTSASSATAAALTSFGLAHSTDGRFPTFGSLVALFWLSAGLCLVAFIATILLHRTGSEDDLVNLTPTAGGSVVRGCVIGSAGRPVRNAVVTLLDADGNQVDWGSVDSVGEFAVAVPCIGHYLLVVAAEGWSPQSKLIDVGLAPDIGTVVLPERLTISGVVESADGAPVVGALVALTHQAGEAVQATRTTESGAYTFPLPANGRYVVTAATASAVRTVVVTVWGAAKTLNLQLPVTELPPRRPLETSTQRSLSAEGERA